MILGICGLALSLVLLNTIDAHAKGRTMTGSKGGTRTVNHSYDKSTGNFSRSVTSTGAKGKTRSKSTTGTAKDGTVSGTTTVTHVNGNTTSRDFSGTITPTP